MGGRALDVGEVSKKRDCLAAHPPASPHGLHRHIPCGAHVTGTCARCAVPPCRRPGASLAPALHSPTTPPPMFAINPTQHSFPLQTPQALSQFGTDFTLICHLFPGRQRRHLKNKVGGWAESGWVGGLVGGERVGGERLGGERVGRRDWSGMARRGGRCVGC